MSDAPGRGTCVYPYPPLGNVYAAIFDNIVHKMEHVVLLMIKASCFYISLYYN